MEETIRQAGGKILEDVTLFDRYAGEGIPEGQKSMAFRLTLRSTDRTLKDKEITKAVDRVVSKLAQSLGIERR